MRSERLKRLVDVLGAGLGLLATGPALVVIAAVIRARMGSPVLFRQVRPGLHGEPFRIVKFRTMRVAEDGSSTDAERLTPLGRFLRRTSLDELPELWNVLTGDMSLVGPRPLLVEYLPRYDANQRRRHDVKPGITGWTQIHGRNALGWKEKFELDTWYVDNWSNELDLSILASTLGAVIGREGINHPGSASMPVFRGDEDAGGGGG